MDYLRFKKWKEKEKGRGRWSEVLFYTHKLWISQECSNNEKNLQWKAPGLVKQRNHELISAQSDDSLQWIIFGKSPAKQNIADEVLFLQHDLLLLPFGGKIKINPSSLKHMKLVILEDEPVRYLLFLELDRAVSAVQT